MPRARLLTKAEVAHQLGITPQTLQYHIDLGRLEPEMRGKGKGPAGMMWFDVAEVRRFTKELNKLRARKK